MKVVFIKTGDVSAFRLCDADVQQDKLDVGRDFEFAARREYVLRKGLGIREQQEEQSCAT
jgi:hypothetical protein